MKPCYVDTPARSLIGERMLIVETHDLIGGWPRPVYCVHAQLKTKGKRNRYVCFKAGVVVKQQLEAQRFFPVWARLTMVEGKEHEYYKLDLSCVMQVLCKTAGRRWRVNLTDNGSKP